MVLLTRKDLHDQKLHEQISRLEDRFKEVDQKIYKQDYIEEKLAFNIDDSIGEVGFSSEIKSKIEYIFYSSGRVSNVNFFLSFLSLNKECFLRYSLGKKTINHGVKLTMTSMTKRVCHFLSASGRVRSVHRPCPKRPPAVSGRVRSVHRPCPKRPPAVSEASPGRLQNSKTENRKPKIKKI